MAEPSKNGQLFDSLVTRVDALVQSINDREKILSATKSQIDEFQQKTERTLEDKVGALQAKLDKALSEELKATVDYTKELYARFERMIWLGMVLLAAVSAFIGYQTFSSIPDKIKVEIATLAASQKQAIDKVFTEETAVFRQKSALHQQTVDALTARIAKFEKDMDVVASGANKSAADAVGKIVTNYDTQFRNHQVDTYVQALQRQSDDSEIIRLLAQEFPTIDAPRQGRIAAVLADRAREIPSNLSAPLRNIFENWKPSEQDQAAVSARYQLLIRYRSSVALNEIRGEMNVATAPATRNDEKIIQLIQIIWRVFTGGTAISPVADQSFLGRQVPDSTEIVSSYMPIFKTALESQAASRVFPMILEIRYFSRHAELDANLASVLTNTADDPRTVATLILLIPQFREEAQLYRAAVAFIGRSIDNIKRISASRSYARFSTDFLSYALRNSASNRADQQLLKATMDILAKFEYGPSKEDGIDAQYFGNYLTARNIFSDGERIELASDRNRRRIREIQERDEPWREVDFDNKDKDIVLGSGLTVRIKKFLVDGTDLSDERLGVEIAVEIGKEQHALRFFGSERFLLQSQPEIHIVTVGGTKIRFGIEIRSQQIAAMIGIVP